MTDVKYVKQKLVKLYLPITVIYGIAVLLHNAFISFGWYPVGENVGFSSETYYIYQNSDILLQELKVFLGFGSGEHVMGAMWFGYVLMYAILSLSVVSYLIKLFVKNDRDYFYAKLLCLLVLQIFSIILKNHFGLSIQRVSVMFSAMFLINLGVIAFQKVKITFSNRWMALICLAVLLNYAILVSPPPNMAINSFSDAIQLDVSAFAALYCLSFVADRMSDTSIGNVLALIGRNSFYIMALHIFGFYVCESFLIGVHLIDIEDRGLYTFLIGNRVDLLSLYVLFGLTTPLIILKIIRTSKKSVKKYVSK